MCMPLHAKTRVEMPTIQKNGIGLYKHIAKGDKKKCMKVETDT